VGGRAAAAAAARGFGDILWVFFFLERTGSGLLLLLSGLASLLLASRAERPIMRQLLDTFFFNQLLDSLYCTFKKKISGRAIKFID
jgi:hypothetical protein